MEVDMRNDLPGDFAIGLADIDPVGVQCDELGLGDFLNNADQMLEQGQGQGGEGIEVGFGDDEGVSFDNGADIQERKNLVVFVNPG